MFLKVDHIHNLHFETYGSSTGTPVLFIHGGPGLGYSQSDKRFFDLSKHFVIFYDQRGSGKSTPTGSLEQNKTEYLIEDIVYLLDHLNIESAHIFGGSWGATLCVLFAAKHPKRTKSLVLRGFFSATKSTIAQYLQGGIKNTHPIAWARVNSFVPDDQRHNIAQYYLDIISSDSALSLKLSKEWSRFGLSLSKKQISEKAVNEIMNNSADSRDQIILELHYALNQFFIEDGYVFQQAKLIKAPTTIIHGSYDYLCPLNDAKLLQSKISNSILIICDAGHSSGEVKIEAALKEVTANYS